MNSLQKQHLILIGFMGTGKSTVARQLSRQLELPFFEMDEMIVQEQGMEISNIFQEKGEAYFRDLETALLKKLLQEGKGILSCGGGIILRDENIQAMKKHSTVILLTAKPETILKRVQHNQSRPVLNGKKNIDDITKLMKEREERYHMTADILISTDGKSLSQICEEIADMITK